eukprot:Gb_38062 [translate_table: standard]
MNRANGKVAQVCKHSFSSCHAQHNSSKRYPTLFSVSPKVIVNVFQIKSSDNTVIVFDEVVDTNKANEQQPNQYGSWLESIWMNLAQMVLHLEEGDKAQGLMRRGEYIA